MTKRQTVFAIICLILALMGTRNAQAQDRLPLQRVQTIPMPGVSGRMDHLGVDVEGGRLFAAALGDNQNTVEVIDLKRTSEYSASADRACRKVCSTPQNSKGCLSQTARTALSRASVGTISSFLTA